MPASGGWHIHPGDGGGGSAGNLAGKITVERVGADAIRPDCCRCPDSRGIRRPGGARERRRGRQVPGCRRGEPDTEGHRLFAVGQVAEILGISRDLVYDLLRRGQLRSVKIGRLRRISGRRVDEFVERLDTVGL